MGNKRKERADLIGEKFARLTVVEYSHTHKGKAHWLCRCDCGKETIVPTGHLRSGHTQSCGCFKSDSTKERLTKHGQKYTRLYNVWIHMKNRCLNPRAKDFENYGGRGINIFKDWLEFEGFYNWAMGNGYTDELTIDRIDVNGNYEPSNCRWVTWAVQSNNKRNNVVLTFNGETRTVAEWSEILNISRTTLYSRIRRGCTTAEILRPVEKKGA